MTLFRKVFQNQSRPAEAGEALDEDALRAAFKEMRDTREPLILDPFEHSANKPSDASDLDTADVTDAEDEAEVYDDDEADVIGDASVPAIEALEDEVDGMPDREFEEEISALERDLGRSGTSGKEADHFDGEREHSAATGQSDEDIVANLGRVLAEEEPTPAPTPETSDDEDLIEEDLDAFEEQATEELEAVAGGDDLNPATAFDAVDALPEPETAETFTEDISDLDATAVFAQQQMAALSQSSVEPAEDALDLSHLAVVADTAEEDTLAAVPAPAAGRAGRRVGRVKTRVLGFNRGDDAANDPFGATPDATATPQRETFPVGWLVIVEGPGIGHAFSIFSGASMIGRGEDQVIRLDFGDNSISRNNHAAIAYDEEQNKFYIGHGGKSNIIRRNARPVLSTEELHHADLIRIGETTLRFVALCGSDFQWHGADKADAAGL